MKVFELNLHSTFHFTLNPPFEHTSNNMYSSQRGQIQPTHNRPPNGPASSQQLQTIFTDIFQWKDKYDPSNQIFDQALLFANQKYVCNRSYITEAKEEQPSPNSMHTFSHISHTYKCT